VSSERRPRGRNSYAAGCGWLGCHGPPDVGWGGQRCGRKFSLRCDINMLEAIVIIVALGGLELILWYLDHRQQKKQIELLDSIWAELAIRNSVEEETKAGRH
jgi:hypothetical protein